MLCQADMSKDEFFNFGSNSNLKLIWDQKQSFVFQDPFLVYGIYHVSGDELMTKYDMCRVMGEVFALPLDHVVPQTIVELSAAANRPLNAHLSCDRLIKLNGNLALSSTKFRDGIQCLRSLLQK